MLLDVCIEWVQLKRKQKTLIKNALFRIKQFVLITKILEMFMQYVEDIQYSPSFAGWYITHIYLPVPVHGQLRITEILHAILISVCGFGTYGENCAFNCSDFCFAADCLPVDGDCVRCIDYYAGFMCVMRRYSCWNSLRYILELTVRKVSIIMSMV